MSDTEDQQPKRTTKSKGKKSTDEPVQKKAKASTTTTTTTKKDSQKKPTKKSSPVKRTTKKKEDPKAKAFDAMFQEEEEKPADDLSQDPDPLPEITITVSSEAPEKKDEESPVLPEKEEKEEETKEEDEPDKFADTVNPADNSNLSTDETKKKEEKPAEQKIDPFVENQPIDEQAVDLGKELQNKVPHYFLNIMDKLYAKKYTPKKGFNRSKEEGHFGLRDSGSFMACFASCMLKNIKAELFPLATMNNPKFSAHIPDDKKKFPWSYVQNITSSLDQLQSNKHQQQFVSFLKSAARLMVTYCIGTNFTADVLNGKGHYADWTRIQEETWREYAKAKGIERMTYLVDTFIKSKLDMPFEDGDDGTLCFFSAQNYEYRSDNNTPSKERLAYIESEPMAKWVYENRRLVANPIPIFDAAGRLLWKREASGEMKLTELKTGLPMCVHFDLKWVQEAKGKARLKLIVKWIQVFGRSASDMAQPPVDLKLPQKFLVAPEDIKYAKSATEAMGFDYQREWAALPAPSESDMTLID